MIHPLALGLQPCGEDGEHRVKSAVERR